MTFVVNGGEGRVLKALWPLERDCNLYLLGIFMLLCFYLLCVGFFFNSVEKLFQVSNSFRSKSGLPIFRLSQSGAKLLARYNSAEDTV